MTQHSPINTRLRGPGFAIAVVATVASMAPSARSQNTSGLAGSAQYTAIGAELVPAGGLLFSASYEALARLVAPPSNATSASANYQVVGAHVFVEDLIGSLPPSLFSVTPTAIKAGTTPVVTIGGANFTSPGAGPLDVQFGNEAPVAAVVLDDGTATATAPDGYDAFTNPLGRIDVTIVNDLGSSTVTGGALFTPAIEFLDPPDVGGSTTIRFTDEAGSSLGLYFGSSLATPFPLSGVIGSIAIGPPYTNLGTFVAGPFGSIDAVLPVPNSPALIGNTARLQGLSIDGGAPFALRMTNKIETPILP